MLSARSSVVLFALLLGAPQALAGMYVTGSVSSSSSNYGFQTAESNYGSASLGFDLGRYVRLSFTHSQQFEVTEGFKDKRSKEELQSGNAVDATSTDDTTDDINLISFATRTHVIGNSVDLQLILYEGQVFVPYVSGGLIVKSYHIVSHEAVGTADEASDDDKVDLPPVPNLGVGIGLRLNKEFTLKLAYLASPGYQREPFDTETKTVWDKKVTLGLTYQL